VRKLHFDAILLAGIFVVGAAGVTPPPDGDDEKGWTRIANRVVSDDARPVTVSREPPARENDPGCEALVKAEKLPPGNAGRRKLLGTALGGEYFPEVVRLELALSMINDEPEDAAALVIPLLKKAPTREMKEGALDIVEEAARSGLSDALVKRVRDCIPGQSRRIRRRLKILCCRAGNAADRKTLFSAVKSRDHDVPALDAARKLMAFDDLEPVEKWYIARVLYRHALYDESARFFEEVSRVRLPGIPRWKSLFFRGRCYFRQGQYVRARAWYGKALEKATKREDRASLEVHIGRCFELEEKLDKAVDHARRAVLERTSDARRLFLVRLRLRTGRSDLAEVGISRIRSHTNRSRGRLLVALSLLAGGDTDRAIENLARVGASRWKAPARVLRARLLAASGRPKDALRSLEEAAPFADRFWGWRARGVMRSLDPELVAAWRKRTREACNGRNAVRALRRWAVLEIDEHSLEELRRAVGEVRPLEDETWQARGLAGELLAAGLDRLAFRWDPRSLPRSGARATLSSAWRVREFPWLAIPLADAAWRQLGADFPPRVYPEELAASLYPLPAVAGLEAAAKAEERLGLPLLAAVAREESRWDPDVLSAVGARGLVQLMPATARAVAEREGLDPPTVEDLFNPAVNLRLGAGELEELLEIFDSFTPAVVAAYNAGTDQARLWLEQCGESPSVETYVLTIGFSATRKYTKDVLLSEKIYEDLTVTRK